MCWGTLRWLWLLWRRRTIVAEAWGTLWRRRGRWRGALSISSPWAWGLLALALWGALLLGGSGPTRTSSLLVRRTLGLPSGLEVGCLHCLLLWRTHGWVVWLLRRSLAHMKWVRSIWVLTGLSRTHHHLREAHLLLGVGMPGLHGLHMGMLHPLLLGIYQLLVRRSRMGRLSWIKLVVAAGRKRRSSSLKRKNQVKIKCIFIVRVFRTFMTLLGAGARC